MTRLAMAGAARAAGKWTVIRVALRARRQVTNRSQQDIAIAVGRSRETVARWETGAKMPSAMDLAVWCGALGMELRADSTC